VRHKYVLYQYTEYQYVLLCHTGYVTRICKIDDVMIHGPTDNEYLDNTFATAYSSEENGIIERAN
jgi:hypothetical protein